MKILNINSYYFSSSLYEPMESTLLKNDITLSTYVPGYKDLPVRKEITSLPPEHVFFSICYKKYDRLFFYYKHRKIRKDLLNKYDVEKYDILHAHSLFSNGYIAYSAYKKYKIPYIVAVRSTDLNLFFKKMPHLRKLGIAILKNASAVIFLSHAYKKECIEKYIPLRDQKNILDKSKVVPNGINEFWLKNKVNTTKEIDANMLKIIFVGDDSKRKNLKSLILASDLLKSSGHNIELAVVGKFRDDFFLAEVNKKEYINYHGYLEKEDLLFLYRQNDIFVLPSLVETFGLVYAEALSQGLPVIYSKNQGFDEQFNAGKVGYAVESLNPEDIAEKILKVKNNYREINNAVLTSVDKFDWNNIINLYKNIYISILN